MSDIEKIKRAIAIRFMLDEKFRKALSKDVKTTLEKMAQKLSKRGITFVPSDHDDIIAGLQAIDWANIENMNLKLVTQAITSALTLTLDMFIVIWPFEPPFPGT